MMHLTDFMISCFACEQITISLFYIFKHSVLCNYFASSICFSLRWHSHIYCWCLHKILDTNIFSLKTYKFRREEALQIFLTAVTSIIYISYILFKKESNRILVFQPSSLHPTACICIWMIFYALSLIHCMSCIQLSLLYSLYCILFIVFYYISFIVFNDLFDMHCNFYIVLYALSYMHYI